MIATATKISLEEFQANPDIHYYDFNELHNGEIVLVPGPTVEHMEMQQRLEDLLRAVLGPEYTARREFYLTLPTESRRVDVAAVRKDRLQSQRKKVFFGAPELIIEILSPSNTALDVDHLRAVCLEEGTRQFWAVNMEQQTVMVYKPGFEATLHSSRRRPEIMLSELNPGAVIPLDAIFTS